jgi:hypothetical protein
MMGRSSQDQGQLFYSFNLEEVVPDDHLVRAIACVLDLSWIRAALAPHYSHTGRPSIDPVLVIRGSSATCLPSARNARCAARSIVSGGQRLHDLVPDASPPPANETIVASVWGP